MRLVLLLALAALGWAVDTVEIFGLKWTVPVFQEWSVADEQGAPTLSILKARPQEQPRRPIQFAIAQTEDFEQVTVEADVKKKGDSVVIVNAYQAPSHFNYAHLSQDTGGKAPVHNGIFHVFGGDRVRISSLDGPAAIPTEDRWYHVKLVYDARTHTAEVFVEGKLLPAFRAIDLSLGAGKVGLGSFFHVAQFRNVKVTGTPAR
ncbi:MAG TPA: hypothetical protein VEQ63_08050 [Bryobacteraceae bacterium]|nr:hypothetical protein [Bryobacteraceae bacterium]